MSKIGLAARTTVRAGVLGVASAAGVGLFSAGAANADTFIPLPDGSHFVPAGNLSVELVQFGQSALISPTLASNPASRVTWVTGTAGVKITGGDPEAELDGTVSQYYIVGCQIDISGLSLDLSGSLTGGISLTTPTGFLPTPGVAGGLSIPLGPGEVGTVSIGGASVDGLGDRFVQYKDAELAISGCAGYAQARAVTKIQLKGDHRVVGYLYGAPFSLG